MEALYAFMRHTDDLADNRESIQVRRESLARWRTSLQAELSSELESALNRESPQAQSEASKVPTDQALLPALADAVRRFEIPTEHLLAVIEGVEMDLDGMRYDTFDDLATYCRRVASAVGLACIYVWGFRGQEAFEPARKCGIALQLTNILRDLKEDAERGRVYLPLEDLRLCNYPVDDLAAGVVDERFRRLMRFQIDRARRFYQEGAELFDWLEPHGRPIFGMMMTIYHSLLRKIECRPSVVFSRRVGLSRWKKLRVAGRWLLLPARRPALP